MICGSGGSKSRLAKAAGAEPAGQMRDENCTPLWREAHLQVKMYKAPQLWTTFGSWDVEKAHAVVAQSTFRSEHVQNTSVSDHFWKLRCRKNHAVVARSTFRSQNVKSTRGLDHVWKLRCRKSARRCGAKHISKSKCTKHTMFGPLLEVQMSFRVAGARDCAPLQKWAKRKGFVAFPKTMAGMGHLKRICKDAFFVAGAVQKTCSWEMLGGQGADFLRGFAFWSIRCAGLLRWFCVTGAALRMTWHQFSVAGAVGKSQNALVRGCQLCTQLSIFEGSLAEFFRFWCLELRKMRKSRRIASFRMLSSSKNEDVSQNSFVLDVVMFKHQGRLAEFLRFWSCR